VQRAAAGRVHVFAGREVPGSVLAERAVLASQGVAHVTVAIDARGSLAGPIVLATRGVLDPSTGSNLLVAAEKDASDAVDQVLRSARERRADSASDDDVAEAVRLAVRRSLSRGLGFKPTTIVTVVRVGG
jgi:ribonuclease J